MTRDRLVRALALIDEPEMPVDGDCLRLARRITEQLQREGMPARQVTVVGWTDHANLMVIHFGHQATEVDGWMVDFTARQFNDSLPARWICRTADYPAELADKTRVHKVTIGFEGETK